MIDQDALLIEKAKSGDRRAFGKLVMRHQKKLLFLAYDLVGNYEDAKDVAQEAFVRSYERLDQFQGRARFTSWLYRITVNAAMDFHRRQKRKPQDSLDEKLDHIYKEKHKTLLMIQPEQTLEKMELRENINEALEKLSANQKTATVLKFFHGRSTKEIAQIMECSESTVRIHLFRAVHRLKEYLCDYAMDKT